VWRGQWREIQRERKRGERRGETLVPQKNTLHLLHPDGRTEQAAERERD
jgi:hypothetical protein